MTFSGIIFLQNVYNCRIHICKVWNAWYIPSTYLSTIRKGITAKLRAAGDWGRRMRGLRHFVSSRTARVRQRRNMLWAPARRKNSVLCTYFIYSEPATSYFETNSFIQTPQPATIYMEVFCTFSEAISDIKYPRIFNSLSISTRSF